MKKHSKKRRIICVVSIIIGVIAASFVIGWNIAKNNALWQKNQSMTLSNKRENNPPNPDSFFPSNSHLPSHLVISPPPTNLPLNKTKITLKLCYNVELGGMQQYYTSSGHVELVLIDKENQNISNEELTKQGNHYEITFFEHEAGRLFWDEKPEVKHWYFGKNNKNFTLKPILGKKNSKSKVKVKLSGYNSFDIIGNKKGYFVFTNFATLPYDGDGQYFRENLKGLYINENHPEIKKIKHLLENQGELQRDKEFIVKFGRANEEIERLKYVFYENNDELEIQEM